MDLEAHVKNCESRSFSHRSSDGTRRDPLCQVSPVSPPRFVRSRRLRDHHGLTRTNAGSCWPRSLHYHDMTDKPFGGEPTSCRASPRRHMPNMSLLSRKSGVRRSGPAGRSPDRALPALEGGSHQGHPRIRLGAALAPQAEESQAADALTVDRLDPAAIAARTTLRT